VAFSVPVLIAGVAVARFGLHRTAVAYSAALAVLAAAATGTFAFRGGSPAPGAAAAQAGPAAQRVTRKDETADRE
jgi:hypothetical protein